MKPWTHSCIEMLAAVLALIWLSATASASVVFSYVTDKPTYNMSTGSASVKFYLQEIVSGDDGSVILSDGGLYGGGLRVKLMSGSGISIQTITPAAAFAGPTIEPSLPSTDVSFSVSTDIDSNFFPVPDAQGLILLATVTFAKTSGTGAAFQVGAMSDSGNTITFDSGLDLDFTSSVPAYIGANTTTRTINFVVPEPCCAGCAVFMSCAMFRRKRIRQNIE